MCQRLHRDCLRRDVFWWKGQFKLSIGCKMYWTKLPSYTQTHYTLNHHERPETKNQFNRLAMFRHAFTTLLICVHFWRISSKKSLLLRYQYLTWARNLRISLIWLVFELRAENGFSLTWFYVRSKMHTHTKNYNNEYTA